MIRYCSGHFIAIALLLSLAACAPPDTAPGPSSNPAARPPAPSAQTAQAVAPTRPYMGANIRAIELPPNQSPTGQTSALRVEFAIDGSPAQAAGIEPGDIILSINGTPTDTAERLVQTETSLGAGASVPLVILRKGQQKNITVQLAPLPPDYDAQQRRYLETHIKAEQQAADDAERAGNSAQAFDHVVRALRLSLSAGDDPNLEAGLYPRLLNRVAALMPKLRTKPAVPSEADRHNRRALALLQSAAGPEDFDRATREYSEALYEAPWIPDLYYNYGLAFEKAGYTEKAAGSYRYYLILNPAPRDLEAIKQKLADLEVLADERKPWLPFVRTWPAPNGSSTRIDLRGRNLTVTTVKSAPNFPLSPNGDVLLTAVIHGRDFTGKWHVRTNEANTVKCYGAQFDMDSFGGIDPTGNVLRINTQARVFTFATCQETGTETQNPLNYDLRPAPPS